MKNRSNFENNLAAGLMVAFSIFFCNELAASGGPKRCSSFSDSTPIKISQYTKTNSVKLYSDLLNEVIIFSARGEDGKAYQLFLFDMDGKLVKQTKVLNRETTLLTKFEKGSYTFEVFSNDDRVQNGSIVIQ